MENREPGNRELGTGKPIRRFSISGSLFPGFHFRPFVIGTGSCGLARAKCASA